MRRFSVLALALSLSLTAVAAAPVVAQPGCDPFLTPPDYDETVPTFPFGEHQMTVEEIDAYLAAIDGARGRVTVAEAAKSVEGKSIKYAVVGSPAHLADLAGIKSRLALLQNPQADPADVAIAAANTPAILWVAANVHGGEESGADASLHALYELVARDDCVVDEILANAIVVILPTQNPDGREIGQRRNMNGFDMNRDWFARTQPETDGKLDVVREYPPTLFIDAHEFGLADYFFPPNADPIYHEIPDQSNDWINGLYSPAIVSEFQREGVKFFHGAPYDFFATIFGDTVPAVGFHAAGMTFEKESDDPIVEREHEHFTSMWASLAAGASARDSVVAGWRASWVEAAQEGAAGTLEPNAVFEKGHSLYQPVPSRSIRGYLLRDDADRAGELQLLVRRLQRMDVKVYRLNTPVTLTDFHPYFDPAGGTTLPANTYWVPMAQAQKHWIQALLREDPWIPFEVTYDVTAWSNPLLMNLRGGWTSQTPSASALTLVPAVAAPAAPTLPADAPRVGLFEIPNSSRGFEAAGQTRYLFRDVWHLPFSDVTADDITAGLAGIDVLVMPDGYANYGVQALGAKGKRALKDWVNGGGRIVAWQGGVEVAVKAGVSSVKLGSSRTDAPGTLIRVSLAAGSPLAAGIGARDWVMYQDDRTMQPGLGTAVATFPAPGTSDYATSGLAIGVSTLAGSSAVVDEAVGSGRVVAMSVDPNFRAWTQGTQRILWNAVLGPWTSPATPALAAGSKARAAAEAAAATAAGSLPDVGSAIRIRVRLADAAATAKVLAKHGATVVRQDLGSETLFLIANKKDLSYEEHPTFALIVGDLEKAGIDLLAASLP